MIKLLVLVAMLVITYSLGSALYYMFKDRGQSTRTVKALSMRIGLSILLLAFVVLAISQGWVVPGNLQYQ